MKILVAGASGLIGGHLVKNLLEEGHYVRAVGRKSFPEWKQLHNEAENLSLDLSLKENCYKVTEGVDEIYNLAAEIGGVGFIEKHKAETMLSVLINTHLLLAARDTKIKKYFYSSSYAVAAAEAPQEGKALSEVLGDGHIWEKLFSEKLCAYFREDFGLETRIGRLQNIFGPYDSYEGGRERAPAALCRKAAIAKANGNFDLEIWGDGAQLRNFLFVEDAVKAIKELTRSNITDPVRVGSEVSITINELVDAIEKAAGIKFNRIYKTDAPQGTKRNFGSKTEAEKQFAWRASTPLEIGIKYLYDWVEKDLKTKSKI